LLNEFVNKFILGVFKKTPWTIHVSQSFLIMLSQSRSFELLSEFVNKFILGVFKKTPWTIITINLDYAFSKQEL